MKLSFEWNEEKAKANLKKHRVGFDEAITVFTDPFSMTIHDLAGCGKTRFMHTTPLESSIRRRCQNSLRMLKKAVQQGRSERRGEEVRTALRVGRSPF